jgi:beta-galactosidase
MGYAYSKDLVHWFEEELLPVMHHKPATVHSWAPEVIYDQDKKDYLIYWASQIKGID